LGVAGRGLAESGTKSGGTTKAGSLRSRDNYVDKRRDRIV
jgi:hypothetical protein